MSFVFQPRVVDVDVDQSWGKDRIAEIDNPRVSGNRYAFAWANCRDDAFVDD